MERKNFKIGDKVVMHTCYEAGIEKYKGKIWTCISDSFSTGLYEHVFLDGFRGSFCTQFLQIVNLNQPLN